MATGVVFLQSDVDDTPKNLGTYKAGNTDVIRQMLREQQKECQQLHANALFREFRGEGQKQRKFGKGYVVQDMAAPMVDDFQAEGQTRMFELIKYIAAREEKPLKGVWATFGKPYVCLGDPNDPTNKLPKLYRDELANQDGKGGRGGKKNRSNSNNHSNSHQSNSGTQGPQPPTEAALQRASSSGPPRTGSAKKRIGTAMSQASMQATLSPGELEEVKLTKGKSIIKFTNHDLLEVKFPEGPLKKAAQRRLKAMSKPGNFISPDDADQEATDPFVAYGQVTLPKKGLKPIQPVKARQDDEQDDGKSVFITQGAGGASAEDGTNMHRPSMFGNGSFPRDSGIMLGPTQSAYGGSTHGGMTGASPDDGFGEESGPSNPLYTPIVEASAAMRGDEDNPVHSWHNNFLRVRQEGRAALQQALWERSEGRQRARSIAPMAAKLSSILMSDLDIVKGKMVPYASVGVKPESPYLKMDQQWLAMQETAKQRARQAQQLDPEELRVLQRFYDQLCALVEAQRMSDPLSLMVIHKVKALLEAGTFLHKVMLTGVMDHVSKFVNGCGLAGKYNKYLLSVLTFISKCVGVNEQEFEDLVQNYNICMVVYNTTLPPSKLVPETPIEEKIPSPKRAFIRSKSSKSSKLAVASNGDSPGPEPLSPGAPTPTSGGKPGLSGPSSKSAVPEDKAPTAEQSEKAAVAEPIQGESQEIAAA